MRANQGFTLIELMVAVAILVIIATIAAPSFGRFIEGNRLVSGTNLLISSMNFARTEAIKRGTTVTFSTDGGLDGGWCVHTGDASGSCAANQIRSFDSPGSLTFTETSTDIVFDRRGFLASDSNETFTVVPENCESGEAGRLRTINVSPVGRVEVMNGDCP